MSNFHIAAKARDAFDKFSKTIEKGGKVLFQEQTIGKWKGLVERGSGMKYLKYSTVQRSLDANSSAGMNNVLFM